MNPTPSAAPLKGIPHGRLALGQQRRGENERNFRHALGSVAALLESVGGSGAVAFRCECGHVHCAEIVDLHPDIYRRLRTRPVVLCAADHALDDWTVLAPESPGWRIVDRARERRWQAARIGRALWRLVREGIEEGAYVLLDEPDRGYYVQFALQDGTLYCEAVHNKHIEGPHLLNEAQIGTLLRLGFREPEHEAQNWFRWIRAQTRRDCLQAAGEALTALETAYGMRCGREVKITGWWEEA